VSVTQEGLDDNYTIGERLRAERERLGLQVHELGHMCGCTVLVQKRLEAGTKPITAEYLHALHHRTDARVLWIVSGEESPAATG
jgi:transcriptional regulator with XRE-family HTH domain